ncbi:hypothetical protein MAM1_0028c02239 [Mucor ambiguus]|uniref:Transmembrane protein n=1 Tax=Mucor ambiguus TaxID=91626 RepID=A0A0C9MIC6_9FUNG|nr:hypothetical protein MAM1_0028c02239 [Mucor ambiguus]
MHNPYLNGSNFNESTSQSQHILQTSDVDQHSYQPSPSTTRGNEKHVLYIDDYTTEDDQPPSYSSTQGQAEVFHSSDVDIRASARRFPASTSDAIPLDPFHAHVPLEPETAPLMEPDTDRHTPPTAPSIDQIEISGQSPFDRYKRVRQCSGTKFILAFAIFVVGVILMATALATVKCYSDGCVDDKECKQCENKTDKGIQAAGFSFFILISLCIIWRFIKLVVL